MTSNKMLVHFWLDNDCSQEQGEVSISWKPINFMIYSPLFVGMIDEAATDWLAENKLVPETLYEVIFEHIVEHDGGGALLGEWFFPMSLTNKARKG
jgi:hypothetical protein